VGARAGTRHGGSALFFADLLALNAAAGKVITIDIDPAANAVRSHPRIEFLLGNSGSPDMADTVAAKLPTQRGPMFVILDSDHRREHVLTELQHIVPLMRPGDYLVVEDTCINGHPLRPDYGPGPYEALEEFLGTRPEAFQRDVAREQKFGFTFAPRGYLIKT
jgi:cephalosporin hydroxylase